MSTMLASHGHSEACCNMPPIVCKGYTAKGSFEDVGGYTTYATGPAEATKGIVSVYDIFGFFDQTIQGADLLATSDDRNKYRVLMPDWFEGEPFPIRLFPPDTEEKQKKLGAFFAKNPAPGIAGALPAFIRAASVKYPSIKSWGIIGYCWGAKVVSLASAGESNPFCVGAECHPAMMDAADAEKIKMPMVVLASKDEPAAAVEEFDKALAGPKHVETFGDQIHGWMAARADLSDARVSEEYRRGYRTVLDFFGKNWA